jgi:hypothetical protein
MQEMDVLVASVGVVEVRQGGQAGEKWPWVAFERVEVETAEACSQHVGKAQDQDHEGKVAQGKHSDGKCHAFERNGGHVGCRRRPIQEKVKSIDEEIGERAGLRA